MTEFKFLGELPI